MNENLKGVIIELVPEGLTQSTSLNKARLIIFRDKDSGRHLPVLINSENYALIYRAFVKNDYRAMGLFKKLTEAFDIHLAGVFLTRDEGDTEMFAVLALVLRHPDGKVMTKELRVSMAEGFTAAMITGASFYITRYDFEQLYNREMDGGRIAIPVAAMPRDLLQEALNQAVEGENFELASVLRDEIKKRDDKKIAN